MLGPAPVDIEGGHNLSSINVVSSVSGIFEGRTTGTPAFRIVSLAADLSPIRLISSK